MAAHVFPPLGGHWRDFAFWADGLGDLHQTRLPEVYATIAVIIGACLALAVLLWADCALYVDLPFAEPMCHLVGI